MIYLLRQQETIPLPFGGNRIRVPQRWKSHQRRDLSCLRSPHVCCRLWRLRARERQKLEKGSDRIENEGQQERERETEMRERPLQRHKRYSERERATKIDRKCKNDSVCESYANQACNKEAPPQWVIKALPWFA